MKKIIKLTMSLLLALSLSGCATPSTNEETTEGTISLHFTIVDQSVSPEKVLFDDEVKVSSDSKTLADVLTNAPELKLVSEDSQYGLVILGLMGVEGDWDKGPWWLYSSDSNTACVDAGYCAGASDLEVKDGDSFTFKLTSEMN